MFPETVQTDRLRLERFCHETVDVRDLYECFAVGYGEGVDEVFEHVPQTPYRTLKDAHEMIDDAERRWEETEGAEDAVRPKAGEPAPASSWDLPRSAASGIAGRGGSDPSSGNRSGAAATPASVRRR